MIARDREQKRVLAVSIVVLLVSASCGASSRHDDSGWGADGGSDADVGTDADPTVDADRDVADSAGDTGSDADVESSRLGSTSVCPTGRDLYADVAVNHDMTAYVLSGDMETVTAIAYRPRDCVDQNSDGVLTTTT